MVKPILIKLYINPEPEDDDTFEELHDGGRNGGGGGGLSGGGDSIIRYPIETTNRCYWCHQKFTNTPVFTPIKYEMGEMGESGDGGIFHVRDNFCSFSHAASYIHANYKMDVVERMSLLYFLQFKMKGHYDPIKLVPPIQLVCEEWGVGKLSVMEYMELDKSDTNLIIYYPPLVPSRHVILGDKAN